MDTQKTQPDVEQQNIMPQAEGEPGNDAKTNAIEPATGPAPTAQAIHFANKNQAQLLSAGPDIDVAAALKTLGLTQPEALLMMIGGTGDLDEEVQLHLTQLFSRGIARLMAEMDAIIIDGGQQLGTMAIMGNGVMDRGRKTPLLGIAPAGKVTCPGAADGDKNRVALDPNHSHFILTEGEAWGDAFNVMNQVTAELAGVKPVVSVLVSGNDLDKKQVLQSVRNGWPVIILKDSGGLADEISALSQERPPFIADPELAEIIVDGKLYFIQLKGSISTFERLLEQLLSYQDDDDTPTTLELVWKRFATYDKNAERQQSLFSRIQVSILILGVVATFLALVKATFTNFVDVETNTAYRAIDQLLFYILLIVPITMTALIAAANRFSAGNKWILLRAGAESLKKEICRYRARVEIYSDRETRTISREMKLHRKEELLSRKLMQTEVNVSALQPYEGPIPPPYGAAPGDDGLSFLTPDRFLTYRLEDQLTWYQNKTVNLENRLKQLQWLIYLFGGVGTLLVAINLEIWIALSTSLVAALTTYMEYKQLENTLMRYNQTAAELTSIRSWWIALSAEEQADPKNIDKLVGQTETTIHSEHAAWVQEMQDTMAELRAEQQAQLDNNADQKSG